MTTQERIDEIDQDISDARQWIRNMGKTGKKYEIDSGRSSRSFEGFSMSEMRQYIAALQAEKLELQGCSGYQGIF